MTEPVFFQSSRPVTAGDVARITGATLATPRLSDAIIRRIAALGSGHDDALVFATDRRRLAALNGVLTAAAILCGEDVADAVPPGVAVLVTKHAQRAFAQIGKMLFPAAAVPTGVTGRLGISERATIDPSAIVEDGATVEAGAVVGPGAAIGSGTVVAANATIGPNCQIGRDGYIGPGVSLQCALIGNRVIIHAGARIGQDGFGYVTGPNGPEKMPQIGRVVIQDDVEIGANTTIDRGALDDSIIGDGAKIDNLVQIGHNCRIGRGCIIAGNCGISGSVTLGDFVVLGGGVGIADHVTIGARSQIAGGSGVIGVVPEDARWAGHPAQPAKAYFREVATLRGLAKAKGRKGNVDG